ncbi:MAG: DUF3899 domain-containing protein [Bacilli bacterium]|jgi:hypothetical protein
MQERQKKRFIKWLGLLIFNLLFGTLILIIGNDYTTWGFSNATFIPGAVTLFMFCLKLISNAGTFDLVSYSFSKIRQSMNQKDGGTGLSAHEYVEKKQTARRIKGGYYLPDIVISALFIVAGIILIII